MTEPARFLADLTRIARGTPKPLLLAISGGPDSMAMLALAVAALPGDIAAATVDHGLRSEAANEARTVASQCAKFGISHATLTGATPSGASLQAHARHLRYALLADHARIIGAAAIATAHHADDQAETFLMRAARGVGLSGLAGIRACVEIEGATILRPLLDWRRAELRAVAARTGMPFVDDPANTDDRHDRTRFRALIEAEDWLDAPRLARSAAALAEADMDIRAIAEWLWAERAMTSEGDVTFAVDDLPRGLLRLLARRAVTVVRAEAGITEPPWSEAANVEPMLDAVAAGRNATQAGVLAGRRGGVWRFRAAPARRVRARTEGG